MVSTPGIRVRQLALRVPERACVRPFTNDLEDALRTASWPHLPGGARLHVRRLRLGRVAQGLSRQALAALLSRRLAETETLVLRWPAPAPASGDDAVVLLPDMVQAAAYGLRAALAGQVPHWAVAESFPGISWSTPHQAAPEVLTRLIALHGPAAPGRLIALPGALPLVLRTLALAPAAALTAWLAPLRAALPEALRMTLSSDGHSRGAITPVDVTRAAFAMLSRAPPSPLETLPEPLRVLAAEALTQWPANAPQTCLLIAWSAAARSGPQAAAPLLRRWLETPREAALSPARSTQRSSAISPPSKHPEDPPPATAIKADEVHHPTLSTLDHKPAPQRLDTLAEHPDFTGELSPHAGLWLLVPLLNHLNGSEAEAAHGTPLCAPILAGFADRLGLTETDPCRAALTDDTFTSSTPHCAHAPPPGVLKALAGKTPLHLHRTAPGCAALGLSRGPVGFASLDAATLHALRGQGVRFAHATGTQSPANPAKSLMLTAQVLAHRLTGQGWRPLCRRAGRVAISNTHIDITFNGHDADPSVRIAGLDTDPGWVPWLGRVVSFHYDYSGVRDWAQVEQQDGR